MREQPLIPLLVLLGALVVLMQVVQPGIVKADWVASIIRFAIPLAILAACQTLVMLTGGIDLSVATVASMAAYVAATQVQTQGEPSPSRSASARPLVVGLLNGIGIAVFRVQPLIMTLATGLVAAGFLTVYQTAMIATTSSAPPASSAGSAPGVTFGLLPNSLLMFLPLAALVLFGAAPVGLRAAAVRRRRQPDRVAARGRPRVAGLARRCT